MTGEIGQDLGRHAGRLCNRGDRRGLAAAEFQDCQAPWSEQARQLGDNAAIGIKPVGTTIERRTRLKMGDLWHQGVGVGGRDVGRIAEYQVELTAQSVRPTAGEKRSTPGEPK
jgi:hypothetical protein